MSLLFSIVPPTYTVTFSYDITENIIPTCIAFDEITGILTVNGCTNSEVG